MMALRARHQCAAFRLMVTASTIWRGTFGNGREIGIRNTVKFLILAARVLIVEEASTTRAISPPRRRSRCHAKLCREGHIFARRITAAAIDRLPAWRSRSILRHVISDSAAL